MLSEEQLVKIIRESVAEAVVGAVRHVAMELEAVRVNALMAEVMALRMQVMALEQFCEYLVGRTGGKHGN